MSSCHVHTMHTAPGTPAYHTQAAYTVALCMSEGHLVARMLRGHIHSVLTCSPPSKSVPCQVHAPTHTQPLIKSTCGGQSWAVDENGTVRTNKGCAGWVRRRARSQPQCIKSCELSPRTRASGLSTRFVACIHTHVHTAFKCVRCMFSVRVCVRQSWQSLCAAVALVVFVVVCVRMRVRCKMA